MKKTFAIAVCFFLLLLAVRSQTTAYRSLPKPANRVMDSLNSHCIANKVKTRKHYITENGKSELNSITSFSADGKILCEQFVGYFKRVQYYTYSGDTTFRRTIEPDRSSYGRDLIVVTVEKFGKNGNILSFCSSSYPNVADSMQIPPLCRTYNYRDGRLVTTVFADGTTEYTAHDNHGQLLEVAHGKKSEAYRRVYNGDKLTECYFSKNQEPERLLEKFTYDNNGLLSCYESYSRSGAKFSYKFNYDAQKKVVTETDNCSTENYTYNAKGYLIKDETITCSQSIVTFEYKYNELGLLTTIIQGRAGISGVLTESFNYTYW